MSQAYINIKNRKARFNYEITSTYLAGLMLLGTEIKSIRDSLVSMSDSYCFFKGEELFIRNLHIAEYKYGNINNHEPLRERKLLLNKRELKKIKTSLEQGGNLSIVPIRLFVNDKGLAKLEIGLGAGKKLYDKRHSLKEKSLKREIDRNS